jgi:hypothetical protein
VARIAAALTDGWMAQIAKILRKNSVFPMHFLHSCGATWNLLRRSMKPYVHRD